MPFINPFAAFAHTKAVTVGDNSEEEEQLNCYLVLVSRGLEEVSKAEVLNEVRVS